MFLSEGQSIEKRHRGEDIEAYLDVDECPRWPECVGWVMDNVAR